jgi:sec-independent protein translocase protein TatA
MPFQLGLPEIVVVLLIALVVLGPKRLPDAGRSAGHAIKEFKDAFSGADLSVASADASRRPVREPARRYTPPPPYQPPPPALDPDIYVPHAELAPPRSGE